MAIASCFEELEIWKLAREIVKDIYRDFLDNKDFAFKTQITAAGISIMNNIHPVKSLYEFLLHICLKK